MAAGRIGLRTALTTPPAVRRLKWFFPDSPQFSNYLSCKNSLFQADFPISVYIGIHKNTFFIHVHLGQDLQGKDDIFKVDLFAVVYIPFPVSIIDG